MKFIRNPEIQKGVLGYSLGIILGTILGGICFGIGGAFLLLAICLLFALLHFSMTYRRYRSIEKLSQGIDAVLHDGTMEQIQECREGELAVLQSQLFKLVLRLHEQAEALKKDKVFLADSLADISHQIKTPMTSIHLLLRFLNEENLSTERRREIVREITSLTSRIDWLIYVLLKLSRFDAGMVVMKKEKVMLETLTEEACSLIAVPMDIRNVRWRCRIQEGASFVGDLSWSVEAVGNILKNCMEHTPEGGEISVTGAENALYTSLVISDTGNGLSQEDLHHLFERFYKGRDSDSGSMGIGLSLSQRIITEQNGTIQVRNRESGGAEFEIRFYKTVV